MDCAFSPKKETFPFIVFPFLVFQIVALLLTQQLKEKLIKQLKGILKDP